MDLYRFIDTASKMGLLFRNLLFCLSTYLIIMYFTNQFQIKKSGILERAETDTFREKLDNA
jgi:hypothetical protein